MQKENLTWFMKLFHSSLFFDQVCLTGETASDEVQPSAFITYEFFEHEIQATPVMKGKRYFMIQFNCNANCVIIMVGT